MRPPAVTGTALLLLALSMIGCGDTVDKNAYVKSVSAVQAKTSADAAKLSSEMTSAKTPKAIAEKLTELGQAVEVDAGDLKKVQAPKEVTTQHAAYVKLMQQFGTDLEALAPQVEKATPTNVGTVLQKASKLTANLSASEAKIVADINAKLQG